VFNNQWFWLPLPLPTFDDFFIPLNVPEKGGYVLAVIIVNALHCFAQFSSFIVNGLALPRLAGNIVLVRFLGWIVHSVLLTNE
jgi:hypothetical protein